MPRFIITAAVAITLAACAPAAEQTSGKAPSPARAALLVENNNFQDVTVYLLGGSTRTRLGTVTSMSHEQFGIPQTLAAGVSDLRVEAVPFASGETYLSPAFQVMPHSQVMLRLGQKLLLSDLRQYERATN